MDVDRNEKVWAWANTGTKMHAFVQGAGLGRVRAMCRKNIERGTNATFYGRDDKLVVSVCTRCEILANAVWDRAEESMDPATEADDLGYVVLVDETATVADEQLAEVAEVPAETLAELDRLYAKPIDMEALHAEELEMDSAEMDKILAALSKAGEALTAAHQDAVTLLDPSQPTRWHYRAHVMTHHGAFIGVREGYVTAPDRDSAERDVRDEYARITSRWKLGNFNINPA